MADLYDEIKEYILSIGFTQEDEPETRFRMKLQIPGREMIINDRQFVEPGRIVNFDIIPLGTGAMLDYDNVPISELQGFKIMDNDFWVRSLEDFKFWIERIFQLLNLPIKNKRGQYPGDSAYIPS